MAERHESVELVPDVTVEHVTKAVLLAALTAVLAQASIDLPGGIPFSFQPFGVFFAGLLLGPVWGGFSMLLYVTVGAAGVPVFSNFTGGIGVLSGPTGGFLVGFVLAAIVIGAIAHRRVAPRDLASRAVPVVALALFAGLVPMYAVGVPWFAEVQGWSLVRAADFLALFAVGDLLKVGVAVGLVTGGSELLQAA
jgi:biotin transport system substrate-specific component